jgi:CRISPR-associated protein Cmr6
MAMRKALRGICCPNGPLSSHFALAYDAWAPVVDAHSDANKIGKVPDEDKGEWLNKLADLAINEHYRKFYDRWKASFPGTQWKEIALASRLLVGHGNASATGVGLTVHHTWGVPMIPGSALKGLCAHYTAATYGLPGQEKGNPAPSSEPRGDARFSGPKWEEGRRRIEASPGNYYRALFGAPDVHDDASAGLVVFHDALYVPGSIRDNKPFAVDVLTVHQRSYYGQDKDQGGTPGERWPNDYDSPNPVGFISVRPGVRFLLAVDGDAGWTKIALKLLTEAIREWGVGGKTASGYGRGPGLPR